MKKYGQTAIIEVSIGNNMGNGMVQVHLPLKTHFGNRCAGDYIWDTIIVPANSIKNGKLYLPIVDRDFDDEHTSLLCPDMQTIIAVHDVNIKIPLFSNLWNKIRGKRIKMSEM